MTRERKVLVGLAVLAAVLLPLTVLFAALWQDASAEENRVEEVRKAAGAFTERFLTIDTDEPEAWQRSVEEASTGAFRRTFDEGLETGFVQAFFALDNATTEVVVEEIYVGDVDGASAHVVVQAETTATVGSGKQAKTRRPVEVYVELDLVRAEGSWKVDGVGALNFGDPPERAQGG